MNTNKVRISSEEESRHGDSILKITLGFGAN